MASNLKKELLTAAIANCTFEKGVKYLGVYGIVITAAAKSSKAITGNHAVKVR